MRVLVVRGVLLQMVVLALAAVAAVEAIFMMAAL
jgi:hypothetical protein